MKFFENPNDNAVYMQGFVAGKRADGEDWARERLARADTEEALRQAWTEMVLIGNAALARLQQVEAERDQWKSIALAYQCALQNVVNEDLRVGRMG